MSHDVTKSLELYKKAGERIPRLDTAHQPKG